MSRPTLLSQRTSGPPTDISGALSVLQHQLRPPTVYVPNLPSVLDSLGTRMTPPRTTSPYEHVYNSPPQQSPPSPLREARRQLPYSTARPSSASARGTPARTAHRPVERSATRCKAGPLTAERTTPRSIRTPQPRGASRLGLNESKERDSGIGTVTTGERSRCRNEVSKKLLDLYDELDELCWCREKMTHQVSEAMCVDPRRAKVVRGAVSVLAEPPREQQKALELLLDALDAARAASVELVAAYLTPEEKRFLGVDTNLFQTRMEKATTYQYAPKRKRSQSAKKNKLAEEKATATATALAESDEETNSEGSQETGKTQTTATDSRHTPSESPSHSSARPQEKARTNVVVGEPAPHSHHSSAASSSSKRSSTKHVDAAVPAPQVHSSKASSVSSRSRRAEQAPTPTAPAAAATSPALAAQPSSYYSTPGYSPAAGQASVEEPRSPASGPLAGAAPAAVPPTATTAPPPSTPQSTLAPLRFNIKQFAIDSSTSTSEKNLTPERVYQPKLSVSTLGGSLRDSPGTPRQAPVAEPVAVVAATTTTATTAPPAAPSVATTSAPPPWTVSAASTGTTVAAPPASVPATAAQPVAVAAEATPPPLPAAPKVSNTRAEFKRFVIDSDSDSSMLA